MSAAPRLTTSDLLGLAMCLLGFAWAVVAVAVLQPNYTQLFADFGGTMPTPTRFFLSAWVPPLLALPGPAVLGWALARRAAQPWRLAAYGVVGLFSLVQVVGFMVSMYLPLFAVERLIAQ